MRSRYDQTKKQILRRALEPEGTFTTEVEVSPDAQRFDGYFIPRPDRASTDPRDLLDRMSTVACTFEAFHAPPDPRALSGCVRKLLNLHHVLDGGDQPRPYLWILSTGRATSALETSRATPRLDWPSGVYELAPLFHTGIVVANELPETRETRMLRLLGAGRTLRRAIAEMKALPPDAREALVALPILVQFRLELAEQPAQRTPEEEEFLMNTQEIMEALERKYVEQGVRKGRAEGIQQGRAEGIVAFLEARGLTVPDDARQRILACSDLAILDRWVRRAVSVSSAAELFEDPAG